MTHNSNPVQQDVDGKWYWWDETWSEKTGPYDSYDQAESDCSDYCESLFSEEG